MIAEIFLDANVLLYASSNATEDWDATIIAAAVELGCSTLYSEDLNHGQSYDGVKVVNPFLS
jgi:predicted nucleic acid-binding protein